MAELTREIPLLADREFLAYCQRQITTATPKYLLAAWDYVHSPAGDVPPTLDEFAAMRELDAATMSCWLKYLKEHPHSLLSPLLAAMDREAGERLAQELGQELLRIDAQRQVAALRDPMGHESAAAQLLCFRADDRWVRTNDAGQVAHWPDRAGASDGAVPVAATQAPLLASAVIQGHVRPVVRFGGQELLEVPLRPAMQFDGKQFVEAPRVLPQAGSLFAVFRPSESSVAGQRLVGWEDSSVGQHGVGLIVSATGAVHAVLRRAGANGDVRAPAVAGSDFQLVCVTWGPAGVTLHRNGEPAGTNLGIDSVTADPGIAALRIGGPGSGSAGRFCGDLAELRVYSTQLDGSARGRIEAELQAQWFGPPKTEAPEADRAADLYDELLSPRGPFWTSAADRARLLPKEVWTKLAAWRAELELLRQTPAFEVPQAVVVAEGGPPGTKHEGMHDCQIYLRGDPANPGPTVPRGFPRILAGGDQPSIREGSGRRELARWLCRPGHPLTARVMVNRIWQHHFGAGLVRTSTNFGVGGERPSHPELLDYLAGRFVDAGWSIKAMHRLIMSSSVYQQSTCASEMTIAADPENRLLARMDRRRLEVEAIRDSLLAIAGRLDATPGGP
ncbi:MAG TPA: DUF1553 domain-containing protein, partial [Pirellulales bacterium]|nr:DUF1553 domain-containing protein [Pirellulales bacterium]